MITAPEVSPEPVPGARLQSAADASTFGGGSGLESQNQEVQKISQEVGQIGALEEIRADQTAVQDATAKLSSVHTQLLTDPNMGLPAYRGTNAMAGQTKLWNEYQKSANELSENLNGQGQKGAFGRIAVTMGNSFLQHTKAHVSQELEKHDAGTFEALVTNKADESGKTFGNNEALAANYKMVSEFATARAQRLGLDEQETKKFMRTVMTTYHEDVIGQAVDDPAQMAKVKDYFSAYKGEMTEESKDRVRDLFDRIPKQQEAEAKAHEEAFYKANERTAILDDLDGKLTLSELQRRFRDNQISKPTYETLEGKLSKPDAGVMRSFMVSNPQTFNAIRQAQLNGSKSPGEIQRMIGEGSASKEITPEDGKYLMTANDKPPTPRDRYVESQANNIRDFGNRYFAETNFFGMPTSQDKTSQEAQSLVSDFYNAVDKSKANGEDIDKIRDQIKKTAMQKRYPGLGNLEKAPDVVIDIKGNVVRLLSPDQHSGLKPRYKITPSASAKKEDQ